MKRIVNTLFIVAMGTASFSAFAAQSHSTGGVCLPMSGAQSNLYSRTTSLQHQDTTAGAEYYCPVTFTPTGASTVSLVTEVGDFNTGDYVQCRFEYATQGSGGVVSGPWVKSGSTAGFTGVTTLTLLSSAAIPANTGLTVRCKMPSSTGFGSYISYSRATW